ncbi:Hint domain-containing protein [Jiella pelagia]|uniref:Hint domain-containing protein n=1 Tax=Jiella pelagia TaxID=2986949 RepID=A0ABY7C383_9HYPH|nr:Hint domain-containing protein [Jiella pelagia]WAP69325.1 Hint domain-containing protein [Jiella pelagia]
MYPKRDVLLSPGHPVLVRQGSAKVLVLIMNLINGTTIARTSMKSVTYWHIERDQHDVLLADGLPAESFFDMGSRAWFDNDLDDVRANPDVVPTGQHGRCRKWRTTVLWSRPRGNTSPISSMPIFRPSVPGPARGNTPAHERR